MKKSIERLFVLPALIVALGLIPVARVTAQTFTTLHSFTALGSLSSTNSDGRSPLAGLILSGDTLYGTAIEGGGFGNGTVFKVNITGANFMVVSGFDEDGNDGYYPSCSLVLSGSTLYGTAISGGSADNGTVFAVNTNGTGLTNLHSFTAKSGPSLTNFDGASPFAGLILSGSTLYGTAYYGGDANSGTVFAVNTNGTGFTNLHSFTGGITNSGGALPDGGLILSGNTLYGTAEQGGTSGSGTVFAVNIDGTGFTNLHNFTAKSGSSLTNSDGALPEAGLVLLGNTLFGTAYDGGSSGQGTVFALNINGTGFTNLHSFTARNSFTNSDGANPFGGLFLSGNALYGTTQAGGISGNGAIFKLNTDGTGFTNLYSFTPRSGGFTGTNSDGASPGGSLILSGNTLYGTTINGGTSGGGTVFSLSLGAVSAPQLTITRSGANVVFTWATNAGGFTLQRAATITNTFISIPEATNPPFTLPISGAQRFFRLISN